MKPVHSTQGGGIQKDKISVPQRASMVQRKTETMKLKQSDSNPFLPKQKSEVAKAPKVKLFGDLKCLKDPKLKVKGRKPIATRKK